MRLFQAGEEEAAAQKASEEASAAAAAALKAAEDKFSVQIPLKQHKTTERQQESQFQVAL